MENRIIAVDDDRDFLEILGMHLVDFGYRDFRVEEDPEKAAALFHKGESFDLALIDMHMPEMDGMALLDLIKTTVVGNVSGLAGPGGNRAGSRHYQQQGGIGQWNTAYSWQLWSVG